MFVLAQLIEYNSDEETSFDFAAFMASTTKETPRKEKEANEKPEVPALKESVTGKSSTQEHPIDKVKETATETYAAEEVTGEVSEETVPGQTLVSKLGD